MNRLGRAVVALGVMISVSGCASKTKQPTPRPESEPCEGQAILIIDNRSGYELDVVEAPSRGGGRTVIATVGNGSHEILVRREGGYYYSTQLARRGATVASESMRRSASDQVRMHRECRPF